MVLLLVVLADGFQVGAFQDAAVRVSIEYNILTYSLL
jgi:hypothetical protein